ncbi:MAG: nucleotidyl transferase AbiEii/AbiGii toxin family protein [Candidatus Sungiibacteriota bacterium]
MNFSLENIRPNVRRLLEKLSASDYIKKFYLAGGTAVALFFHHRRSDDLDFFSAESFQETTLIKHLKKLGKFQNLKSEEDTLAGRLDGIKISFFTLPYALLEKPLQYKNLSVATPVDLALMKILAISDRGTKRDFIDLYLLCEHIKSLDELLILFQKKFGKYDFNIQHIIKSLSYFDDADKGEMPELYIDVKWGEVKRFFQNERLNLARKFFGI